MLFIAGFIILLTSFRRTRLGVAGAHGESMLVDLRDRIQSQGTIPTLPAGWHAECALRSAGGTPFAGDFVVTAGPPETRAARRRRRRRVRQGRGRRHPRAAARPVRSAACSARCRPAEFLPAANDYLLRQNWEEGFATAVHLSLDLETGDFEIRTAGHPPAAHRVAGSGRWVVRSDRGPGARPDRRRRVPRGRAATLRPGRRDHALHRRPGRDPDQGHRARASTGCSARPSSCCGASSRAAPQRLIDALGSRNDDRALVLVSRVDRLLAGASVGARRGAVWHHDSRTIRCGGVSARM